MASLDELKKAFTEIDNGKAESARESLDGYKKSAPNDWRLYAGYYFASDKDDKEYITKAVKYAREARDRDAETVSILNELSDILWDIEDRQNNPDVRSTDAIRNEKKLKDKIINIVIGAAFIVAGCIGLAVGTMNILSIIMILIGIILIVIQIKALIEDAAPTEETDSGTELKDITYRKNELDRALLQKITKTLN